MNLEGNPEWWEEHNDQLSMITLAFDESFNELSPLQGGPGSREMALRGAHKEGSSWKLVEALQTQKVQERSRCIPLDRPLRFSKGMDLLHDDFLLENWKSDHNLGSCQQEISAAREGYPLGFNLACWSSGRNRWDVKLNKIFDDLPSQQRLQSAHLFSDSVVFIAKDLNRAARMYISWLELCGKTADGCVGKPHTGIILSTQDNQNVSIDDFWQLCSTEIEARIQTLTIRHEPDPYSISWRHVIDGHELARSRRQGEGALLTSSGYRSLILEWDARGEVPDYMETLTHELSRATELVLFRLITGNDSESDILAYGIPALASYLARHAFFSKHGIGSTSSSSASFLAKQFDLRYRSTVTTIAVAYITQSTRDLGNRETMTIYAKIREMWLEKTSLMFTNCLSIYESAKLHIKNIKSCRRYLATRDFEDRCAACLLDSWVHILPCTHGICTLCLRAGHVEEVIGSRVWMKRCPVCDATMTTDLMIEYEPTTAPKRILALDGGGVKGIIQLETLSCLMTHINAQAGNIPLALFFDLIIGTSIGGICALGLGTYAWSVEECSTKFKALGRRIFTTRSTKTEQYLTSLTRGWYSPTRIERYLALLTRGWYKSLRSVLKIALCDSLHSSRHIESAFQEVFGLDTKMVATPSESRARVAVVVSDATSSRTEIFPTYNKAGHPTSERYTWPLMSKAYRELKVWEAARATSAAPIFWKPIRLLNKVYQDGAIASNNPSKIAADEGLLTKASSDDHSNHRDIMNIHNSLLASMSKNTIIVSVGCGKLEQPRLAQKLQSVTPRLLRSLCHSMNAEKQHADLNGWIRDNLFRLDVNLSPYKEVQLDDAEAIDSLQEATKTALSDTEDNAKVIKLIGDISKRLCGSLFYFELDFKTRSRGTGLSGYVRTRLNKAQLEEFQKRHGDANFLVNNEEIPVVIPAKVEIPHYNRSRDIYIKFCSGTMIEHISGSPFTIDELLAAQYEYQQTPIPNTLKRKRR